MLTCIGNVVTAFFVAATLVASPSALGRFIFDVQELNVNIVVTGSGSLNLSALTFSFNAESHGASVGPSLGQLSAGPYSTVQFPYSAYTGISGPAALGSGNAAHYANYGSGDAVGVAIGSTLVVPQGYVSGSPLSDSATFEGFSFSSLGLTPGTYLYTWGTGPTADSLTINIGTSVPEPASLAMIAVPLGVAQLRRRRGRRPS